jgi:hypothetical protein
LALRSEIERLRLGQGVGLGEKEEELAALKVQAEQREASMRQRVEGMEELREENNWLQVWTLGKRLGSVTDLLDLKL